MYLLSCCSDSSTVLVQWYKYPSCVPLFCHHKVCASLRHRYIVIDGSVSVFLCELGFGDSEADANSAQKYFVVRVLWFASLMEITAIRQ